MPSCPHQTAMGYALFRCYLCICYLRHYHFQSDRSIDHEIVVHRRGSCHFCLIVGLAIDLLFQLGDKFYGCPVPDNRGFLVTREASVGFDLPGVGPVQNTEDIAETFRLCSLWAEFELNSCQLYLVVGREEPDRGRVQTQCESLLRRVLQCHQVQGTTTESEAKRRSFCLGTLVEMDGCNLC